MIQLIPQLKILLAINPVDFRNGVEGTGGRSFLRRAVRFQEPPRHGAQNVVLRLARVLVDNQKILARAIALVAH
jgi:hypothetical protein